MRKMRVIASREYLAAVRTKTFIISLVIMPVLMVASALMQWIFKDFRDMADKKYVIIDRAGRPELVRLLKDKVEEYNDKKIFKNGQQVKPRIVLEPPPPAAPTNDEVEKQRFELSEKVRAGDLMGFLEIQKPDAKAKQTGATVLLRYQSNSLTNIDFSRFVEREVSEALRKELAREAGLKDELIPTLMAPALLEAKGLSKRDSSGKIEEPSEVSLAAPLIVSFALMFLMIMVVMMTATPLMQSVVEEKMQRIAEVLLGSASPFELMAGKLIGMTGVSLTITLVYLSGACWAAYYFDFADILSLELIVWFMVFQVLAGFMFGSLFIAVGAACTDIKETQNLLLPVILVTMLPMFFIEPILREPNSGLAQGLSLFPFSTPMLMIMRLAIPPGPATWEPILGIVVVLATTVFCVYAAGRIFRVGILMQGKGARIGEMLKWVFRG